MWNRNLGQLGEEIAKEYLEKQGYEILEQNCQNKYGEIDLVCEDGDDLVFVEVKTRTGEQFGLPEDALNKNKIKRLIKNAEIYIAKKGRSNTSFRLDAVCIVLQDKKQIKRVEHYKNITN